MRLVAAGDPHEVVEVIREELKAKGLTQRQLAEHLGFSQKHLSQLMNGRAGITLPLLFRMLDFADVGLVVVPNGPVSER